jgi:hypothetical protein
MQEKNPLKEKLINFQIKAVELLNSSLQLVNTPVVTEMTFNFNIGIEQKIDRAKKLLFVVSHIKITTLQDQTTTLGSASVSCVFAIENFEEIVQFSETHQPKIDDGIVHILNSISLSTTRGVLSQLFKGTFLHNAVLPIVDPKAWTPVNEIK